MSSFLHKTGVREKIGKAVNFALHCCGSSQTGSPRLPLNSVLFPPECWDDRHEPLHLVWENTF